MDEEMGGWCTFFGHCGGSVVVEGEVWMKVWGWMAGLGGRLVGEEGVFELRGILELKDSEFTGALVSRVVTAMLAIKIWSGMAFFLAHRDVFHMASERASGLPDRD